MSTLQQRNIRNNYNHGFGDLGDVGPIGGKPSPIEDRLIEVLHDCVTAPNLSLRSVNLRPFREFLRDFGPRAGWNPDNVALCLQSDDDCEVTIHFTVCSLRRLSHLQEWSANWLLKRGLPIEMLPSGQEYLGR